MRHRFLAAAVGVAMIMTSLIGAWPQSANAAEPDAWGYTTTPTKPDGSPDLSGWTNLGSPRGTELATKDFTRGGVSYTIQVMAPDATDTSYPVLVSNVITNQATGEKWTYVYDQPLGDFSHVDANGGWSSTITYYKKTGSNGEVSVAVVTTYSGGSPATPPTTSTEVLDINADGTMVHHVILTNNSGSTIPSLHFGVNFVTSVKDYPTACGNDCLTWVNNGTNAAYADYPGFRLYEHMLQGDMMSIGQYGMQIPDYHPVNSVAAGSPVHTWRDPWIWYGAATADLPNNSSRMVAWEEVLLSEAEYAPVNAVAAVTHYEPSLPYGAADTFSVAVTNPATNAPYWGVGGRVDFYLDNATTPFVTAAATGPTFTVDTGALDIPVGAHNISVRYASDLKRYESGPAGPYPLTIVKADQPAPTLASTADIAKAVGDPAFTIAATINGLGNGVLAYRSDNAAVATVDIHGQVTIVAAGQANIYVRQLGDANYADSAEASVKVVVSGGGATPFTIVGGNVTKTYGDGWFIPATSGGTGTGAVTWTSSNSSLVSVDPVSGKITMNGATGATPVTITATKAGTGGAPDESASITVTVNKHTLTVSVADATRAYGEPNPGWSVTYSGFVHGDNLDSLTTKPTVTCAADATTPAGTVPITIAGGVADNYEFVYVPGTLTITGGPGPLAIVGGDVNEPYGVLPFTLKTVGGEGTGAVTWASSNAGLVSVDPASGLVTAKGATPTPVTITATKAGSGVVPAESATITVTITKKTLTVKVDDETRGVGEPNPAWTVTYTGFVNGDKIESLTTKPVVTCTADASTPAGTVPITIGGGVSDNYEFVYVPGTLTITGGSGPLAIVGGNVTKTYGASPFTLMTSGGAGTGAVTWASSNASVVAVDAATGQVTIKGATGATPVTITATKAGSGVTPAESATITVTVSKQTLTVTVSDKTRAVGEANPAWTLTYSGFVNGDTPDSLTTKPVVSCAADATTPAGTVPITVSGGGSDNYEFVYVPGTLTITGGPAPLTIDGGNRTKTYGDGYFTLTTSGGSGTGTVTWTSNNSALVAVDPVSGQVTVNGATGATPVTITATKAGSGVTPAESANITVTVAKKTLMVTVADKTRAYGEPNPAWTVTYSGFVHGDTPDSLTTKPVVTCTADATTPAGTVPITIAGGVSDNYDFVYVPGTLTITGGSPLFRIVQGPSLAKTYGDDAFGLTTSGGSGAAVTWTSSDPAVASVDDTGTVTIHKAGPVTISASQVQTGPIAAVATVDITVAKAVLRVSVGSATRETGQANPDVVITYSGFVNGEGPDNLTTKPTVKVMADASTPAGTVPIVVSGGVSDNYDFVYRDGILTIIQGSTPPVNPTNPVNPVNPAPGSPAKAPTGGAVTSGNELWMLLASLLVAAGSALIVRRRTHGI